MLKLLEGLLQCSRGSYVAKLYIFICQNDEKSNGIWHYIRGEAARPSIVAETDIQSAKQLDDARMVRYDARSGNLAVTDLRRS